MRVAILARVSTEGQENEGESLVVQQKRLQECVASLNGTVVKVYSGQESATSGKKARPILDQLLEDSATGVFDAIMVYDMSRFSRDPVKSKISLGILKRNGIKLYIQNQLYDLDNLETNLIVGILNEINSFSAAIQARKSVESKIERARRGFPSSGGRLPFGRVVKGIMSNGQAEWIVDPEKHKQALEVFDLYVNKKKQITDIAKEMGFGEEKTATILHDDPEYIQRFTIDQSETVIVTPVPTLFTPEQQAQIREILSHNRKWRSRVHDYALAHFVRCGLCGTTYHGSAIKNNAKSLSKLKHYRYYQHCHRFKTDLCISRVSAPVIEEAAFFVIGQIFSSQEKLREAIDVATQNTRDAKTRLIAESLELKKETERLSKQKQNLIDAVMNGVLTQEDIATRIQKIGGALAEAKTKIKSNDVLLKNLEAQVSDDLAERIQRMFLQLTGMYGTVNEWNHDLKVRLLKWFFGMGKDNGVFIRHQPNMPNNLVFSIIGNFGPTAMAYVDKDNDCGAMYDTFYSLSPGELRSFESANNNTTLGDLRGIISESLAHDFDPKPGRR